MGGRLGAEFTSLRTNKAQHIIREELFINYAAQKSQHAKRTHSTTLITAPQELELYSVYRRRSRVAL